MRQPSSQPDNTNQVSGGPAPSIDQLRDMAARQQQQIESQQQQLVAKEQRLKYLKQQEYQQHHMATEYDKLRRLREKVEAQELKLRKLRALRAQAQDAKSSEVDETNRTNNNSLMSDLDSIRMVFNEKEKELTMAVTKVDQLTVQLDNLRTGKIDYNYPPQVVELEKLRRELAYRRQLNEQQNNMIAQQRSQLNMGQEEMARIDRRIAELQDRLAKKRMMNQQLANQINAATSAKQAQLRAIQAGLTNNKNKSKPVSTVEPFQRSITAPPVDNHHSVDDLHNLKTVTLAIKDTETVNNKNNDPKYQTLPYNTKFGQVANDKANQIEKLKQEKENNNVGFSDQLPRPPPPMYGGRGGTDYQGNYGGGQQQNGGDGIPRVPPFLHPDATMSGKPISSVAPVFPNSSITTPINNRPPSHLSNPISSLSDTSTFSSPQLSSTPISSTPDSPTKLRPALPPKPLMSGPPPHPPRQSYLDTPHDSPVPPVHGEEGTSVDDEDLPPPPPTSEPPAESPPPPHDSDILNGNQNLSVSVSEPASLDNSGLSVSNAIHDPLSDQFHVSINRRIEMPPAFHFPEDEAPPSDLVSGGEYLPGVSLPRDVTDNAALFPMVNQIYKEFQELGFEEKNNLFSRSPDSQESDEYSPDTVPEFDTDSGPGETTSVPSIIRKKKGNLKVTGRTRHSRRVSFDPLALLLDASLEGELELVKKTAGEVSNPSAANDEGITALHNAICAGHLEIVKFLVLFGCDVNAQDSDGWTPLHCAASCNNLSMVKFLVEHGACLFATTLSDHETAAEKCEEDEEGFDGCSEYLYHTQEKLGIMNDGIVYGVYEYEANINDEITFQQSDRIIVLRKGDEYEKEWWWAKKDEDSSEGYIPRNLLGLYPRVFPKSRREDDSNLED